MESAPGSRQLNPAERSGFAARLRGLLCRDQWHWALFVAILALGVFARTWEFRTLPPGMVADEVSIGVDAYDLYHFGMDHNGISWPVHFVSFGSGQNALYGYLLIPFVALLGLTPAVVRLPMLISGILTLPLVYWIARKSFHNGLGLLAMFFVAISPWHIMLSRFGLESNFFVFLFLLAYACILASIADGRWFYPACIFFALCFFNYGPAYLIVPVFLINAIWLLRRQGNLRLGHMVGGLLLLLALSLPMVAYLLVNALGKSSIQIGPVTIPQLPEQARFLSQTSGFQTDPLETLLGNAWTLTKLLFLQTDGLIYNAFEPYGYFYKITFPIAIAGVALLVARQARNFDTKIGIFLGWPAACILFGILQPVNINRINVVFIAILLCAAIAVDWLAKRVRYVLPIAVALLLIAFGFFTADYHGAAYARAADFKFHAELMQAVRAAAVEPDGPVCMTNRIDMPYIYVLFVEKPGPQSYLGDIQYTYPGPGTRYVRSMGRYIFGKGNCSPDPRTIYLLRFDDGRPRTGTRYNVQRFGDFSVYMPQP
ncbi:MAG TPA: glycosyltransferase family 39 protein [Anaerolineales bacterium]|nr:glycosyltransferase family 39 protein [Anaerolineales bacterium]